MPAFSRPPFRARLFAPAFSRLSSSLALFLACALSHAAAPLSWDQVHQGAFVTALCRDTQGHIFIATEGQGVWRFDPSAPQDKQYTHFTSKDGLGSDDVYALLCDAKDRLWAGTLHGLSVYNGKQWKTYGPLEGVGGFRVFALASCPTNGDVWIATEGGLTRYLLHQDRWQQYSRLDGLPTDAIQCLAFNQYGGLYAGTQADGIAIASAKSDYKTWRVVRGPERPPDSFYGPGLPTSLMNCLLVTKAGAIFAGTDEGLAFSTDGGGQWRYLRGADRADKLRRESEFTGLADNAQVNGIEILPPKDDGVPLIAVHAGGGAAGSFGSDAHFQGGRIHATRDIVDVREAPNAAPEAVYQSERVGTFTYTFSGLTPHAPYRTRLHFSEITWDAPGKRLFNVSLNGQPVLTRFDVFATAGGKNKVVVKVFDTTADEQGQITLAFQGAKPFAETHDLRELAEDYITTLAEDDRARLYVGHRREGLEVLDVRAGVKDLPGTAQIPQADYVTSILPLPGQSALTGLYAGGLLQVQLAGTPAPTASAPSQAERVIPAVTIPLPAPAKPPTLVELNAMLRVVSAVAPAKDELKPKVVALDDDWVTEGDWLGRYGRYWACLCATSSPTDYVWGAGWEYVRYALQMGPNHKADDKLRYWIQWLYTQDPRVLELPSVYLDTRVQRKLTTWDNNRRESEVDDHAETYPINTDGPHVYCTLSVPSGLFYLSLYDVNYVAQGNRSRFRDYRVSVREHPAEKEIGDISGFADQPELAHGRITDFWGGTWKRFLVRGPVQLTIEINRNNSVNTMLPAVMLDLVDEFPPPYTGTPEQRLAWRNQQRELLLAQWQSEAASHRFPTAHTEAEAAQELFTALQGLQFTNGAWRAINGRRFYNPLMRWYAAQAKLSAVPAKNLLSNLGTCYYETGLYTPWEQCQRQAGLTPARDIEKALRWDGTNGMRHGFEAVSDYVAGRTAVAQKDGKVSPIPTFSPGTVEGGGH